MEALPFLLAFLTHSVSQFDLHADQQRAGAIHGVDTAALLHWEVARLHGARTDIKNLFSHWA